VPSSKISTGKKTAMSVVKQNATPSPMSSDSKGASAKRSPIVPSCVGCGTIVTDDVKALQCDKCQSIEIWKCISCLNLTAEFYDHIVTDPICGLKWLCTGCERKVMDNTGASDNTGSSDNSNDKIDSLLLLVEKLLDKLTNVESKLHEKCDVNTVDILETRVRDLEKQQNKLEGRVAEKCDVAEVTQLKDKIEQLETNILKVDNEVQIKVDDLENQMKSSVLPCPAWPLLNDNGISLDKESGFHDEKIKLVVQEELSKKSDEDKDIEARKRNIIIYRIPEKKSEKVSERNSHDEVFVRDLLDCVFNLKVSDGDIEKMYRLGRWSDDKTRPMLVAFKNGELKDDIMSNLRNLKQPVDKFQGIGISHDLHPKEREERKQMIQEAKLEHDTLGEDGSENFRFFVVGQGQRRKVIKIRKTVRSN